MPIDDVLTKQQLSEAATELLTLCTPDSNASDIINDVVGSHEALRAIVGALRDLVRRALNADQVRREVVSQHEVRVAYGCPTCYALIAADGNPINTLNNHACTCAPGVSWVKDAVAAGLHNEEVGP